MSAVGRFCKLGALICLLLPYMLMSCGSEFAHTCSGRHPTSHHWLNLSYSRAAQPHSGPCAACKWATSSVAGEHPPQTLAPTGALVTSVEVEHTSYVCYHVLTPSARAPPVG